jgi:hypothetical protein
MDPMLNAPPPIKGSLGSGTDPDEEERLRKALKERFFGK